MIKLTVVVAHFYPRGMSDGERCMTGADGGENKHVIINEKMCRVVVWLAIQDRRKYFSYRVINFGG